MDTKTLLRAVGVPEDKIASYQEPSPFREIMFWVLFPIVTPLGLATLPFLAVVVVLLFHLPIWLFLVAPFAAVIAWMFLFGHLWLGTE